MYLVKTPSALKSIAPELQWNFSRKEKKIYLTFDDGPTERITHEILDILRKFDAQATFFCIGGNVLKNAAIFEQIKEEGHSTGNHTWNHMNGWKFSDYSYFKNVLECSTVVESSLFRPPYGKITRTQIKSLAKRYRIIMWDVLSGDWDRKISKERCLQNATTDAINGSIVVFHDSEKAYPNMIYALPRALEKWTGEGYSVVAIPEAE